MNWGYGIMLVFGIFVTMMLSLVTLTVRQDFQLVTDNYYEQDLQYQAHITKVENTNQLAEKLKIQHDSNTATLTIGFPKNMDDIKGNYLFFRPSDAQKDFNLPIQLSVLNDQSIDVSELTRGLWKVKVNWSAGENGYYYEHTLIL